jgi:hypothetical protein
VAGPAGAGRDERDHTRRHPQAPAGASETVPAKAHTRDAVTPASPHLRPRDGGEQPTTTMELFFDLVYVFAVTQLSHLVLNHNLSLAAVGRTGFLLLVV